MPRASGRSISSARFALALACASCLAQDSYDSKLRDARQAFSEGRRTRAIALASEAVGLRPKDPRTHYLLGAMREASGAWQEAVKDLDRAEQLGMDTAALYNRRGSAYFKLGKIAESVADFDRAIEQDPAQAPHHWQRGISLYYAGRYADCRAQFELHQSVNPHDVENGAWHFLCTAAAESFEAARAAMLDVSGDGRRPMAEIYRMYRGQLTPEDVLRAGERTSDRTAIFYANLYVGLFYEAKGDLKRSATHIARAAEIAEAGGYMGNVAQVHQRLRAAD